MSPNSSDTTVDSAPFPGARWWKVDFHAHSPASFDFNGLEGTTTNDKPSTEDWLLAYMRAEIDALVLADHNTGAGIDLARETLIRLRSEGHADFREVAIFGGVEITVNGGLHLLAVFDIDTSSEVVTRVLNRCDYSGSFGGSDSSTANSFQEVAKEIVENQGLAIPAHADGPAGYFSLAQNSRNSVESDGYIVAAEVATLEGEAAARALGWVSVLGSDAHFLDASGAQGVEDPKFPGSHFTWVKMQTPNLNGLRLAISDGALSVIPSARASVDPGKVSHASIESIQITKGTESKQYDLSPWMNAMIGGRGVGKSTLIEVVRLVLDRFAELPPGLAIDLEYFSPRPPQATQERFWDQDTTVQVIYRKTGRRYRVSWLATEPANATVEVHDGTDWTHEEGSVRERFPVFMYSQKQIYEISKQPQSLLAMIDSQPEVEYQTWLQEFNELCLEYKATRSDLASIAGQLDQVPRLRGELSDVEAQLAQITTLRDSPAAKEFDFLQRHENEELDRERIANEFESRLREIIDADHTALATLVAEEDDPITAGDDAQEYPEEGPFVDPNVDWAEAVLRKNAVDLARRLALEALSSLEASREALAEAGESPRKAKLAEIGVTLAEATSANGLDSERIAGDDYIAINSNRTELENQLRALQGKAGRIAELQSESEMQLLAIQAHRSRLTELRSAFVSTLPSDEIKMKVFTQADRTRLEQDLRHVFQIASAFDPVLSGPSGLQRILGENSLAGTYVESIQMLKRVSKELQSSTSSEDTAAITSSLTLDARFLTKIRALNQFDFATEIDLWFPEDLLHIQYRPEGQTNFRSIDQGSPGQKTAALLTAILHMSNDPLLLDQPEDDLDNKLIFELVVKTLRRIKSTRQVIVATHNANVVVLGDAEQVLVMESGSLPKVEFEGSIQDPDVKSAICKIMEGGETAFEARYNRLASIKVA